jgi:hypothetical protein
MPTHRSSWPLATICGVLLLCTLWLTFTVWVTLGADSQPLPPPRPEATYPAIPAVVPLATYPAYPTDAHGNVIAVLVTATPEPTWTPMAFVWPTPTATPIPTPIMEFSGDMDTGGR